MAGRPRPGGRREAGLRWWPRDCCGGLGGVEYGEVDVTAMAWVFSYVDVTDFGFIAAVLSIAFNPFFWNVHCRANTPGKEPRPVKAQVPTASSAAQLRFGDETFSLQALMEMGCHRSQDS